MENKTSFENIRTWVIVVQILCSVLVCGMFFSIIQGIVGIDLTFLMYATFYVLSLYILVRSLRTNDIHEKEVTGELSIKNIPWISLISIEVLLIIFSWLSQSVGAPIISIFNPEIYTEVFVSISGQETVDSPDFNTIMMLVISFTLVPVFEELLFRGYLLNKWGAKIGIWKAMFMSSLLFALFHFDILVFFAYFASGIFYSLIYLKTRKLIVPIILHSLANLTSSITTFTPGLNIKSVEALKQAATVSTIIYVLLIPIIALVLYRFYKRISTILPYDFNKKIYS